MIIHYNHKLNHSDESLYLVYTGTINIIMCITKMAFELVTDHKNQMLMYT